MDRKSRIEIRIDKLEARLCQLKMLNQQKTFWIDEIWRLQELLKGIEKERKDSNENYIRRRNDCRSKSL